MTSYQSSNVTVAECDTSLVEELNLFFARFEVESPESTVSQTPTHSSFIVMAEEHEERRPLILVNPMKAAGPDDVPGWALKGCMNQLAGVLTRIFNRPLSQSTVPPSSVIVPLPKQTIISNLHDHCPMAPTPIVMKCFKNLIHGHITKSHLHWTLTSSHTWQVHLLRIPLRLLSTLLCPT